MKAVIAGSGIGGLAAAVALHRRRIDLAVLERAEPAADRLIDPHHRRSLGTRPLLRHHVIKPRGVPELSSSSRTTVGGHLAAVTGDHLVEPAP